MGIVGTNGVGMNGHSSPPRPHVCMFVRNNFRHDNRVLRQARTLIDQGFQVTVFAVAENGAAVGETFQGGIRVVRVLTPSVLSRTFYRIRRTIRRRPVAMLRSALHLGRRVWSMFAALFPLLALCLGTRLQRAWPKFFTMLRPRKPNPLPVGAAVKKPPAGRLLLPLHRLLQTMSFGKRTGLMAAALKPVAYHCHDLNSIWAGWKAKKHWPAPLIYDSHELWPHRNRLDASRLKTFMLHWGDRFFARRADGVITVSPSIANHMEQKYGVRQVTVIRNTPPLALRAAPPAAADMSHLPHPRYLYLGGVFANRGLEQIIKSLAYVERGVLVAVGPSRPAFQTELEALATKLGVRDRVSFVGTVPEETVVATASQCDVGLSLIQNFCLSYYYSLPNKLFEYLHAGLPVLVSDFPDMRAIVREHDAGATCDPGDPRSIARGLNELGRDPVRIAALKRNALQAAMALNWEREREAYLGLYRRLIPADQWPADAPRAAMPELQLA